MENMKFLIFLILASYFLLESNGDPIPVGNMDEVKIMDRGACVGESQLCSWVEDGEMNEKCCEEGLKCLSWGSYGYCKKLQQG